VSGKATDRLPLFGALGFGALAATILLMAIVRGPALQGEEVAVSGSSRPQIDSSGMPIDETHVDASGVVITKEPTAKPFTNAELDAASTVPALEALSTKYPSEPRVWRKLASSYDSSAIEPSLRAVRRLFELDPTATTDAGMQKLVSRAASGPTTTADMAFETMTTMMGSAGPDVLYDLVVTAGTPTAVATRAWDLLQHDENARKRASPALKVAIDLRAHNGCDRKPYIAVAERDGDKRSITYLQMLLPVTKCGFLNLSTCADCFGDRSDINRAIQAINARASKPAP
jgi:hypothetical protein